MHFILIVAFLTGSAVSGSPGVSMQEFDTMKTCEAAGEKAHALAGSLPGSPCGANADQVRWVCVPK
jgi:hypothetical protein